VSYENLSVDQENDDKTDVVVIKRKKENVTGIKSGTLMTSKSINMI